MTDIHNRRARTARRLLTAIVLTGGTVLALGQPAGAAVTAAFSGGTLSVFGDNLNNTITVSRNAAGSILVNGGAVSIPGGSPTVANTALIQVFGQGGNDTVTISEVQGALPRTNLFGGVGNDVLTGGSGADMLFGQSGNDTALGKGGIDHLFGGTENDTLTGGDADDRVFGEGGDDRMIWNPGDDTDLNEGGAGVDTVELVGGNGAETFTATANGTRVRVDRITPAPFAIDVGTSEKLVVKANGGDDRFSATGNLATLIAVTVDAGAGNDTVFGTNGADVLIGGDGNDVVDGQQGNDRAFLGGGDDRFQWDPGDGSDTVEGQAGSDELQFNGSAASERFDVSANGARLRFTRDIAAIVLDADDLEVVDVRALGGADLLTVNDLSATDVVTVETDLAGTLGGTAGDAAADTIVVNGTIGSDAVDVTGSGTAATVSGLPAQVVIARSEGANDRLVVNALAGDDVIDASELAAGVLRLTADGGVDNDVLIGSSGDDVLLGGPGDDVLLGGPGTDVVDGGEGDNVVLNAVGAATSFAAAVDTTIAVTVVDPTWLAGHLRPELVRLIEDAIASS